MKTTVLKFFTLSAAIFAFSTISFGQDIQLQLEHAGAILLLLLLLQKYGIISGPLPFWFTIL